MSLIKREKFDPSYDYDQHYDQYYVVYNYDHVDLNKVTNILQKASALLVGGGCLSLDVIAVADGSYSVQFSHWGVVDELDGEGIDVADAIRQMPFQDEIEVLFYPSRSE